MASSSTARQRQQTLPNVRRQQVQPRVPARVPSAEEIAFAEQRVKDRLAWLGTLLVILVVALGIVARYSYIVKTGYEVHSIQQHLRSANEQSARLEATKLSLASPERIMSIATQKLGMQPAGSVTAGGSH